MSTLTRVAAGTKQESKGHTPGEAEDPADNEQTEKLYTKGTSIKC